MFREALVGLAVAFAIALVPAAALAAAPKTDLTILVDGSGSIDADDWDLQRQGFAIALSDVASVPLDGSIAIGVVQWSSDTTVEFPLTQIDDQADLDAAKNALLNMSQKQGSTASGEGVYAGTAASVAGRRPGAQPVHCMSTDGTLNAGRSLGGAVADAKANGIARYSVIGIDDFGNSASLRSFYGQHVYGGGAVTIARNTAEFATLIGGSCLSPAVRLRALEVNQGVQDWQNTQAIVRDRKTVVRAFVDVPAGTPATRVTGRLIGRRGGSDLPGSPLPAVNLGSAVLAREDIVARREILADSLNFVLPQAWTNGDVELEFEAGGAPVDCKEPGGGGSPADDCVVRASFGDARDLGVTYWSVMIDGTGPHTGLLTEQIERTRSALPISSLTTTMRGLNYPAGATPDLKDVNDDLLRFKEIDRTSCTGLCSADARDVYYGVVDGGADSGGLANGIPGQTASGHIGGVAGRDDTGYARNRAPHEIAHTLGVHHAVDNSKGIRDRRFIFFGEGLKDGQCGEVASSDAPGHTPFVDFGGAKRPGIGSLTNGDDAEIWGLDSRFANGDVNGLAVVDPHATWALMGYCKDGAGQERWTSAFEWGLVLDGIEGRAARAARRTTRATSAVVAPPAGSTGLLVSGVIAGETGAVTFKPAVALPYPGDAAPGAGTFTVRLENAAGDVLATRRFEPVVRNGDTPDGVGEGDPEEGSFAEVMSVPPSTTVARIVVSHDTAGAIGTSTSPAGAPPAVGSVAISNATIGDTPVDLDWTGPAGSTYAVFFSRDDGATWSPLAFDLSASRLKLDPGALQETANGRLAVASSDGVNGTVGTIANITVTNSAPTVEIVSPAEDDAPPSGVQTIRFEATAGDRDEVLPDSAVSWSSDRDGVLGNGGVLERRADQLSEGTHVITATVTDGRGASGSDTQTIEVFRVAPPPPSADLRATVSGPSSAIVGGSRTSVRLRVVNDGPNTARRLHLELTLGAGLQASVPATLDAWTCAPSGAGLACDRPSLASGSSTTLDVPVDTPTVSSRTTRSLSVEVGSSVADPRTADNTDTGELTLDPAPPSSGGGGSSGSGGSGGATTTPGGFAGTGGSGAASPGAGGGAAGVILGLTRVSPRRVAFTTTPRRDATRAYTFTTKGRVFAPPRCGAGAASASAAGCIPLTARACAGEVTVTFKRLVATISARTVRLRPDCSFASRVAFRGRSRQVRGTLRVLVHFSGNATLKPRSAPSRLVAAGPLRSRPSRGG